MRRRRCTLGNPNGTGHLSITRKGRAQYAGIRYSKRLAEAGIALLVGSKGDSYDNALAEAINGLYKAELIHCGAPRKTKESVERAALEWVASTTTDRGSPSSTSRLKKLRQTTAGNSPIRPPRWRPHLNLSAPTKPGAAYFLRSPKMSCERMHQDDSICSYCFLLGDSCPR